MEKRNLSLLPGTIVNTPQFKNLIWPILALVLLLLFNLFFTPHFFRIEIRDGHLFGSLMDILNRAAPVMLLAIGMTLVIGTGGIDLSVGAVIAITGAISTLMIRPSYPWGGLDYLNILGQDLAKDPYNLSFLIIPVGVALLLAALAGAWNGFLVSFFRIQPIVATLILMVAGRGIAQLITNGKILVFIYPPFQYIGGGFFLGIHFPIILVAIMLILTYFFTRKTAIGLFIEAIGVNPTATRYTGINANFIKLMVYSFCGFCAGLAGLIIVADIKGADSNNAGLDLELDAILSVVMGGTPLTGGRFSLGGSIIGALFVQTLTTTILTRGVHPAVTLVVRALVVVAVCLLQSSTFRQKAFGKMRRAAS